MRPLRAPVSTEKMMSDLRPRAAGGPGVAEDHRQRAEELFEMKKKSNSRPRSADHDARAAEAEKTARLRALRMAAEAAAKESTRLSSRVRNSGVT
jgi:hypothetical protein